MLLVAGRFVDLFLSYDVIHLAENLVLESQQLFSVDWFSFYFRS